MKNSPTFARIVNRISCRETRDDERALAVVKEMREQRQIMGWSQPMHYAFFEAAAFEFAPAMRVLICGVYRGLDLVLMQTAARHAKCQLDLTGVDLFENGPCVDWTPEQRAKGTWEANGIGPPPDRDVAINTAPGARVITANSIAWMMATEERFNLIYLDTSHDQETVSREIVAAKRILAPRGILSGDDYWEPNTGWGVDKACCDLLPFHVALWNRIWISR